LPEAQLDRFLFCVHVGYPSAAEEEQILAMPTGVVGGAVEQVLSADEIRGFQDVVLSVPVSRYVVAYAAKLVRATRPIDPNAPDFVREMVEWGAGPRAGQHLILAGKAFAAMAGRAAVSVDDIKAEVARRRVDGIIHYVQAFCFRQIEDLILRKEIALPILTLEGNRPGKVDFKSRVRIEAFLDMLRLRRGRR
jgi:MoxR-like ATPase